MDNDMHEEAMDPRTEAPVPLPSGAGAGNGAAGDERISLNADSEVSAGDEVSNGVCPGDTEGVSEASPDGIDADEWSRMEELVEAKVRERMQAEAVSAGAASAGATAMSDALSEAVLTAVSEAVSAAVSTAVSEAVAAAVAESEERLLTHIRARGQRPAENGTSASVGVRMHPAVERLTRRERAILAERAGRGETVRL